MHEWPIERELDEKLRRLVLDEVAAADARQIGRRARTHRRGAWLGPGLVAAATLVLLAALVWRAQGLPAVGGPTETPGDSPTATTWTPGPTPTPTPPSTPRPVQTLEPGLTPGPTADPALMPRKTFDCYWLAGFAVALADGRALVAGGGCQPPAIFDPVTRTFRATGMMNGKRANATATLLSDGRVLVSGGRDPDTHASLATDEIYDPRTGRFTPIGPARPRAGTAAALLRDGRVLIIGSEVGDSAEPDVAEVFDPANGTFTPTGPLLGGPTYRLAVALADGRVLVVNQGADQLVATQVYDPGTNSFRATIGQIDAGTAAARLPDGRVMIVSGHGRVDAYDPSTDRFSRLAALSHLSDVMACTILADGRILVIGPADDAPGPPTGWRSTGVMLFDRRSAPGRGAVSEHATISYTLAALVYEPSRDQWIYLGHLNLQRLSTVGVAPLPNGGAIVIGDEPGGMDGITAELFDPKAGTFTLNE